MLMAKHKTQLVENNKFIQTNNNKNYSLRHKCIREVDGNSGIKQTNNENFLTLRCNHNFVGEVDGKGEVLQMMFRVYTYSISNKVE